MATAQQLINRSGGVLRLVNQPGDAVDATTSAAMLTILGDIISMLGEKGKIDIPAPATLGTALDVSPGTVDALTFVLAERYAIDAGKVDLITGLIANRASDAHAFLSSRNSVSMALDLGADGLMVSRGGYNINSDT